MLKKTCPTILILALFISYFFLFTTIVNAAMVYLDPAYDGDGIVSHNGAAG